MIEIIKKNEIQKLKKMQITDFLFWIQKFPENKLETFPKVSSTLHHRLSHYSHGKFFCGFPFTFSLRSSFFLAISSGYLNTCDSTFTIIELFRLLFSGYFGTISFSLCFCASKKKQISFVFLPDFSFFAFLSLEFSSTSTIMEPNEQENQDSLYDWSIDHSDLPPEGDPGIDSERYLNRNGPLPIYDIMTTDQMDTSIYREQRAPDMPKPDFCLVGPAYRNECRKSQAAAETLNVKVGNMSPIGAPNTPTLTEIYPSLSSPLRSSSVPAHHPTVTLSDLLEAYGSSQPSPTLSELLASNRPSIGGRPSSLAGQPSPTLSELLASNPPSFLDQAQNFGTVPQAYSTPVKMTPDDRQNTTNTGLELTDMSSTLTRMSSTLANNFPGTAQQAPVLSQLSRTLADVASTLSQISPSVSRCKSVGASKSQDNPCRMFNLPSWSGTVFDQPPLPDQPVFFKIDGCPVSLCYHVTYMIWNII